MAVQKRLEDADKQRQREHVKKRSEQIQQARKDEIIQKHLSVDKKLEEKGL